MCFQEKASCCMEGCTNATYYIWRCRDSCQHADRLLAKTFQGVCKKCWNADLKKALKLVLDFFESETDHFFLAFDEGDHLDSIRQPIDRYEEFMDEQFHTPQQLSGLKILYQLILLKNDLSSHDCESRLRTAKLNFGKDPGVSSEDFIRFLDNEIRGLKRWVIAITPADLEDAPED